MQSNHPRSAGRAGFTLIEILVVIAIIAILAALLAGGVIAILGKGPEAQTRNDILQISAAMQQFKSKYGFYPPETVRLCSNYSQYGSPATPYDTISIQAIARVWPKLGQFSGVQWAGPNTPANLDVTLEGDQALVFWLGGPPATATTLMGGFSVNPADPIYLGPYTAVGGTRPPLDRVQFMTFDTSRLTTEARTGNNASAYFPSFLDGYKKAPYVYFSSGSRANAYTTTPNTLNVLPYLQTPATATTPATYWNSTTFQIISAGLNGQFAPGGVVWPSLPPTQLQAGVDDMTNFTDVKLGVSP